MCELHPEIKKIIEDFDNKPEPFSVHTIHDAITKCLQANSIRFEEKDFKTIAEGTAFHFSDINQSSDERWGTYHAPMFVMKYENGQEFESPSIEVVSTEIIKYWEERAKLAQHPVLKNRYADLVWDFSRRVCGDCPNISMAQIVVDTAIIIANNQLCDEPILIQNALKRALSISIGTNDNERTKKLSEAIMTFEENINKNHKSGLWGFSFNLLVENKKVNLSEDAESQIINGLESKLAKFSDISKPDFFDPHSAEAAALRLAKYYNRLGQKEDVVRVLMAFGQTYLYAADMISGMVGASWLKKVYETYLSYGMKVEADELNSKISELGEKSVKEMSTVSTQIEWNQEEIDNAVNQMNEGSVEDSFRRITNYFIQDKDEVVNEIMKFAKDAVLQSMLKMVIVDHDGRPVAEIGSVVDDIDGRVIHSISQNMGFQSMFLRLVIENLIDIKKVSVENVMSFLYESPLFKEDKKEIIEAGIRAYFNKNYLISIHTLIPQVEDTMRNFVKLTGGPIYKIGRNGSLMLKNFDELLRYSGIREVIGESAVLYLKTLYCDQRGWNLRNTVCHGIAPSNTFGPSPADRVFHSLLILASIRENKKSL